MTRICLWSDLASIFPLCPIAVWAKPRSYQESTDHCHTRSSPNLPFAHNSHSSPHSSSFTFILSQQDHRQAFTLVITITENTKQCWALSPGKKAKDYFTLNLTHTNKTQFKTHDGKRDIKGKNSVSTCINSVLG